MDINYLQEELQQLAPEYQIPEQLVIQLLHLMNEHPNPDVRGAKLRLQEGIEKIIETAVREGDI